jgi:hypothetical protein
MNKKSVYVLLVVWFIMIVTTPPINVEQLIFLTGLALVSFGIFRTRIKNGS